MISVIWKVEKRFFKFVSHIVFPLFHFPQLVNVENTNIEGFWVKGREWVNHTHHHFDAFKAFSSNKRFFSWCLNFPILNPQRFLSESSKLWKVARKNAVNKFMTWCGLFPIWLNKHKHCDFISTLIISLSNFHHMLTWKWSSVNFLWDFQHRIKRIKCVCSMRKLFGMSAIETFEIYDTRIKFKRIKYKFNYHSDKEKNCKNII